MENAVANGQTVARVLLVDDHPTFREGLRSLISRLKGLTVCAEADGESTAMRMLASTSPDLMIVDLNLQDGNGLKVISRARQAYPALKILVASMYEESLYGARAIKAGGNGYVCKQDDPDILVRAITQVSRGETFISEKLANSMREHSLAEKASQISDPAHILSNRELQIFSMIGSGLSTKEIAHQLHLSTKTVDTHRDHIKRKIGVADNSRLIHRAVEWVLSL
jgi:DNA-binding NarL/FixJ family response regulator